MVKKVCKTNEAGKMLLKTSMENLRLTAQIQDRILLVSRTYADLAGAEVLEHLVEAIRYRSPDREGGWCRILSISVVFKTTLGDKIYYLITVRNKIVFHVVC